MKNGASQAVLVRDLFIGDGPYLSVADDFVASRCSGCGGPALEDTRFLDDGYFCPACWSAWFAG